MKTVQLTKILLFKSAVIAFFLNVFLLFMQTLFFSNTAYLGVSTQGFSTGIVQTYPSIAGWELLKVFSFIYLYLFFATLSTLRITHSSRGATYSYRSLMIAGWGIAYLLKGYASALSYPALYETFFSKKINLMLFNSAKLVNPNLLHYLSNFLILVFTVHCITKIVHKHLKLRTGIAILVILSLACGFYYRWSHGAALTKKNTSDKPSILFIAIDSLRSDKVTYDLMPEAFSLKSLPHTTSFEDHIVGIPRTFPSWIEILQGRYAARSKIRHMFPGFLPRRDKMQGLPAELDKLGYNRAVISDFAGDIFPRFDMGYDKIYTPNMNIDTLIKMNIDQFYPLFLPLIASTPGFYLFENNLLENPAFADPAFMSEKAIQYLSKTSNQDKPFFLTLFYSTAHFPYAAPWPWYTHFSPPGYDGNYLFQKNPDLKEENRSLQESDIQQIRGLYNGALGAIDQSLATLFNWLKEKNLWDNTIIVLTADHGEDLLEFERIQGHGDHLRGEHVIKVPLLLKLPKNDFTKIKTKKLNFTTRSIDLTPTLLGLLGEHSYQAEGIDLSPWLFNLNKPTPDIYAYTETEIWFSRFGKVFFQKERLDYPGIGELLDFDPGGSKEVILNPKYESIIIAAKHRSLTKGAYKLIYTPTDEGATFKLYDRLADPYNSNDIAIKEPVVFATMKDHLLKLMTDLESPAQIINDFVVPQ
jgi:arylsulfatase A-like enzyme